MKRNEWMNPNDPSSVHFCRIRSCLLLLRFAPQTPMLHLTSAAHFSLIKSSLEFLAPWISQSSSMANHQFLLSFLFLPAAWIFYGWYCLLLNYLQARKIGVPLVILPISHENPLWMIVDKTFIPLFKSLPFGSGAFTRYNWRGWEFEDKNKSHLELGDVFIAVTPGKNWLYLCNAEALLDVFHRRADFSRPLELLGRSWGPSQQLALQYWTDDSIEMLNVFGPNLGTVRAISPISHTTSLLTIPKQTEGQQWQRHRKITASCFNEQNNDLVWAETVRQAKGMLQYWSSTDSVRSTAEDTRVLSLHVLSSAGFGKSYPFQSSTAASAATNSASYKQSLQLILDNCVLLMVVGQKNLSKSWLPNKWKRIFQATLTFKQYMTEIYEEEKKSMLQGKPESNNLMTSLVRASRDMAGAENEEPRMKDSYSTMNNQAGLTETEIYGNIFVFNFAGHDTTAHTLAYAIVILAAHPEVQDWIAEELQSVLGDQKPEDWSYNGSFPRLKRCLAVLVSTPQHSGQIKDSLQLSARNRPPIHPCCDCKIHRQATSHPHGRR